MNKLARAIADKRFLLGTVVTSPSPALAEALSNTSIDWLCFDMEHSTLDIVGPQDLSGSLGKPGNVADEAVQTAIAQVLAVARQRGKPAGIFVGSEDAARREIARGFTFIAVGADVLRLTSSVEATVSSIRSSS